MSDNTAIQHANIFEAPKLMTMDEVKTIAFLASEVAGSSAVSMRPKEALFIVGYGRELGLPPFASLRMIHMVKGKPTVSGEAMLSLIRRSGLATKISIQGDAQKASVTMARKDTGETYTATFTIEDAKRAGLTKSGGAWAMYPQKMLKWRAISEVAKFLFGDVIGGLYTTEEIAPDAQYTDAGEILVENNTPPQTTPKPNYTEGQYSEVDDDPAPADKNIPWYDDIQNITMLVKMAREKGYIEEKDGAKDLLKLLGKPWSNFETGKDAFRAVEEAHKALEAEAKKQAPSQTPPKAEEGDDLQTTVVEIANYDGKRIWFDVFTEAHGSIPVSVWSRKKFAEMVGKEFTDTQNVLGWEPDDSPFEIPMLRIQYQLKTSKNGTVYGALVTATPIRPSKPDANDIDAFFAEPNFDTEPTL
jgi:hypothetical protein